MHDGFVLLKRERDLNDKERLLLDEKLFRTGSRVQAQGRLLRYLYEGPSNPQTAIAAYEAWTEAVVPEVRNAYSDLIRAFTNWRPWIINYF